LYHSTTLGRIYLGDAIAVLSEMTDDSVDLVMTSPPFGLVRKKDYGNVDAERYVDWFRSFGVQFHRVLKSTGSLVIDIGGAWIPGQPTRSLYHYELLIMLCRELGFHLAQEFYWWNPSKLPSSSLLDENLSMRLNESQASELKDGNLDGGLETFRSSLGKVHLPPDPRQRPDLSFIRRANAYRGVA